MKTELLKPFLFEKCKPTDIPKIEAFFTAYKDIKIAMREKAYIFDEFVIALLKLAKFQAVDNAEHYGKEASNKLYKICRCAIESKPCDHPFYEKAKQYYLSNQYPYQETLTISSTLTIELADEFMQNEILDFFEAQYSDLRRINELSDEVQLNEYMLEISKYITEERLDDFIKLVKSIFFLTPMVDVFYSVFVENIVYELLYRDIETDRRILHLLLD